MRLNANGIGKSHVLKLQMALKKSVLNRCVAVQISNYRPFFSAKGRFVSEICTKLRLNFLQTVVVRYFFGCKALVLTVCTVKSGKNN